MTGYGRGYYGTEQLAPRSRGGGGWWKIVAVVGLGAVVWFVLPRGSKFKHGELPLPVNTPGPAEPLQPQQQQHDQAAADLDQLARLRGFSSTKAFEDSIVATARELKASGAKVELGPHFQHLESRLAQ